MFPIAMWVAGTICSAPDGNSFALMGIPNLAGDSLALQEPAVARRDSGRIKTISRRLPARCPRQWRACRPVAKGSPERPQNLWLK
jgi:hypothetical protein